MKKSLLCYLLVLIIILLSCAKRGSISGGLKDTIAPVLKLSFPKNYSKDFQGNSIKLTFDEYVKLKNIDKQLIISPPLSKKPQITPTSSSKTITIKFLDTLQANTTYNLNFGQSIEDNNEGNPYRQFKYVFSTGAYIDSLTVKGLIADAYEKKGAKFVSVMLYEIDANYTDSLIYKKNPRYITNTLDSSTSFQIENIKAGKYRLVALTDENSNYRFDSTTEKIGFYSKNITVPNDSLLEVKLFKEEQPFKAFRPAQTSGNSALLGFEGKEQNTKLVLKKDGKILPIQVTKVPNKDSLNIWFKPLQFEKTTIDSLDLNVTSGKYSTDFTFKIKKQKADTLSVSTKNTGVLHLNQMFSLNLSIPVSKIDDSKFELLNKDSTSIPFKLVYDEMKLELNIDFKKEPLEKYKLKVDVGALTDYLDQTNTELKPFQFETKNISDYGNLRINLENVKNFPVIIALIDKNGVVQETYYSEKDTQIDFNGILPNLYSLRLIYDENKNGHWDAGNFLERRQSEEVIFFPKDIDVRANWDIQQTFILK